MLTMNLTDITDLPPSTPPAKPKRGRPPNEVPSEWQLKASRYEFKLPMRGSHPCADLLLKDWPRTLKSAYSLTQYYSTRYGQLAPAYWPYLERYIVELTDELTNNPKPKV